jgi:hypothetical protein
LDYGLIVYVINCSPLLLIVPPTDLSFIVYTEIPNASKDFIFMTTNSKICGGWNLTLTGTYPSSISFSNTTSETSITVSVD